MGSSFHETVRGRNFFEGQLPQLIKSLTRIADNLEKPSQGINASTVYVCYHENSSELSIENPIVQQMCIAYSLDEVKSIMLDWLEDGESNKYVPLNEYDQMEFFSDIMLGKDTSLPIYYNQDENSDLYYSLTVKMCSVKNSERKEKKDD